MKPITVITLDDHYLVRQGIRSLLAEDESIRLVGEGSVGDHLAPLIKRHEPDVVLLDIGMPQQEIKEGGRTDNSFRALPAIARLRNEYPDMNIIVVSQYASQVLVEGALEMGVRGYLLKGDALSAHLADAIRAVYRGGVYLSEGVSNRVRLPSLSARNEAALTTRQREIIRAIAAQPELTYAQHADQIGISEHTFTNHLRQIFSRLGVSNVTAAVVRAMQLGIVSLGQPES